MLLTKVCDCLYRYGFRKFIILNGHGGNCKAIEQVGMELHKKGAWLACLNWWLMAGELRPEWKGGHGGVEETAGIMGVDLLWWIWIISMSLIWPLRNGEKKCSRPWQTTLQTS